MTLNLKNVEVICSRIEKFQPEQSFSTIVSRAFTSLNDIYACSQHLLTTEGRLLAMKGPDPEDEISALSTEEVTTTIIPLSVPGVTAARTLVQIVPR